MSAALAVLAGPSAVLTARRARKLGHGLVGLVALWSLVAALAFSGTLLTWLVFADALAVGVLALADLTAHEATTEKVVHQLVVHDGTTASSAPPPEPANPAKPSPTGPHAFPLGARSLPMAAACFTSPRSG